MIPVLSSLIALQQLDTAAELARRRLTELPVAEQQLSTNLTVATAALDDAKARIAANHTSRRELEKNVAAVDTRLARFDDHRAAVKTNQEYTALLHEIATAKAEKDSLEEQILLIMEAADGINADIKAAEAALAQTKLDVEAQRRVLDAERQTLEAELTQLTGERAGIAGALGSPVLAKYEQLLKQRRMQAVAEMVGELCTACHVRLRPAIAQTVRRNAEIVHCDSCQRILFFRPAAPDSGGTAAQSPQP
jgi:predicted  nucleic acid-binding Zn-ribbon protein